jgi:hypothetical protein
MADDRWSKKTIFMPKGIPDKAPKLLPHYNVANVKMTARAERVKRMVLPDTE